MTHNIVDKALFYGGVFEDDAALLLPDNLPWSVFLANKEEKWHPGMITWGLLSILPEVGLYNVTKNLERRAATPLPAWELRQPLVSASTFCRSDGTPTDILAAVWAIYTTAKMVRYTDVASRMLSRDPSQPVSHLANSICEMTTANSNLVDALISGKHLERKRAQAVFDLISRHVSNLLGLVFREMGENDEDNDHWLTVRLAGEDFNLYLQLEALHHDALTPEDVLS